MRPVFYTFLATLTLTACSTVPYYQPVTEVAGAVRLSGQEMEKIALKADNQAKAAFFDLYRTSPAARESLRLTPKGCTRAAAMKGETCYAQMTLPGGHGLVIRAGNELSQAVRLTRQLAHYTFWLKKIAAADDCKAAGDATQAAFAQGVKLYELVGKTHGAAPAKMAAPPAAPIMPWHLGVCVYLERQKFEALQVATRLADPAVQAASRHLVAMLTARAFSSASYLKGELAALEGQMLPDTLPAIAPAARNAAAARYVETVAALDRSLKYTAGLTALAAGMGPSHAALMTALNSKTHDFADVYRAAQTLRHGMRLLTLAFELEAK